MEIWAWVQSLQEDLRESGYGRLADLIDQIPNDVVNNRPERVAAALPEALTGARAIQNPWLEVFLRHWGMQNRMINYSEGEVALGEATALLDFAHRPETIDCPQAMCVTQDIATCYANVDGPGWAQERLNVCQETLARIDPTWPCFECLSREYADALLDQGRAEEAVQYLKRQASAMESAGESLESDYQWQQAEALWKAGHAEEALEAYRRVEALEDPHVEEDRVARHLDMASILAELGRGEEAFETLPCWDELTPGDYYGWAEAAARIVRLRPEANHWRLGRHLQMALDHLLKVGAHRKALLVAEHHGHAAVARGARKTAEGALKAMEGRLPQLRTPLDAPLRVKALAEAVAAMPADQPLPVPAASLLKHLESIENRDPEQELAWLLAAHKIHPDDPELARTLVDAFNACGLSEDAGALLWRLLDAHPGWRFIVYHLLDSLMEAKDAAGIEHLCAKVDAADAPTGCWIRARWAFQQKRWKDAGAHAQRLLTLEDDDDARNIWAQAAMKAGDFDQALALRKAQMERRDSLDKNLCWDALSAASAAGDWETVREIAAKLDLELSGTSGVVEEDWGRALISFEENGERVRYMAARTGPVTARIIEPAGPKEAQHARDWVVFDASPMEEPPEDEEARKSFIHTYSHLHTLEHGGFDRSWLLYGADPGDKRYAKFRDALWEKQWACWAVSDEDYRIQDPSAKDDEDDEGLPGVLVLVAAPKRVPAKELHITLKGLTEGWKHPLCWRALAEHVDLDVIHHQEIEERYGL